MASPDRRPDALRLVHRRPALGRVAAEATAEYVAGSYRFEVLDGVSHWVLNRPR